ncbi:hypothetical protein ACFSQT_19000 [Mesorhizobium calcicola]|uniref:Uncharacterized protein n=1 Tax=Mesorhizobium calcicola TaxID=1300310 RepID=A0ABW4WHZ7_9HYPH
MLAGLERASDSVETSAPTSGNRDVRKTTVRLHDGRTVNEYDDLQHDSYYISVKTPNGQGGGQEKAGSVRDGQGLRTNVSRNARTGAVTTRTDDDLGSGDVVERTRLASGVEIDRTTHRDGSSQTVVTTVDGRKTTLGAGQDAMGKDSPAIARAVERGDSLDAIAARQGVGREQIEAELAAVGLGVRSGDKGGVKSTELVAAMPDEISRSDDAKGKVTIDVVDGQGRRRRTITQDLDGHKRKTVEETFNGYTLTTAADGHMRLRQDATGREWTIKAGSAGAALAHTLLAIDPHSRDARTGKIDCPGSDRDHAWGR